MKFNHIGLVVANIVESARFYEEILGLHRKTEVIYDPIQKVKLLFLSDMTFPHIIYELIEPQDETSPSSQWLKKGNTMHHICYEVDDIQGHIAQFVANGSLLIMGPVPAIAFNDREIAFVLTKEKLIIEFLESEKVAA